MWGHGLVLGLVSRGDRGGVSGSGHREGPAPCDAPGPARRARGSAWSIPTHPASPPARTEPRARRAGAAGAGKTLPLARLGAPGPARRARGSAWSIPTHPASPPARTEPRARRAGAAGAGKTLPLARLGAPGPARRARGSAWSIPTHRASPPARTVRRAGVRRSRSLRRVNGEGKRRSPPHGGHACRQTLGGPHGAGGRDRFREGRARSVDLEQILLRRHLRATGEGRAALASSRSGLQVKGAPDTLSARRPGRSRHLSATSGAQERGRLPKVMREEPPPPSSGTRRTRSISPRSSERW